MTHPSSAGSSKPSRDPQNVRKESKKQAKNGNASRGKTSTYNKPDTSNTPFRDPNVHSMLQSYDYNGIRREQRDTNSCI